MIRSLVALLCLLSATSLVEAADASPYLKISRSSHQGASTAFIVDCTAENACRLQRLRRGRVVKTLAYPRERALHLVESILKEDTGKSAPKGKHVLVHWEARLGARTSKGNITDVALPEDSPARRLNDVVLTGETMLAFFHE